SVKAFNSKRDRTAFFYRRGRINAELNKREEALSDFQEAIDTGKGLKYYYAANAALQIGKIYEHKKNYMKARQAYNVAIQMKDHDYESSIETQAKAGLTRIK